MKTFQLLIITPYGQYFNQDDVEFLKVSSSDFVLGILPNHAPLISTLAISVMEITRNGKRQRYAIGGGVIKIEKDNKVTLLLDSIEHESEIDVQRAIKAKQRAEQRLQENNKIDVQRAKLALARALNRLKLTNKGD